MDKAKERLLRFLLKGEARLLKAASTGKMLVDGGDRGVLGVDRGDVDWLVGEALVSLEAGKIGLARSADLGARFKSAGALSAPEQNLEPAIIVRDGLSETVVVNGAESPLGALWRRRDRHGRRFLEAREVEAGERLRRDFTRGQLAPRLGVNWAAAGASGRRGGSGNAAADLTDVALAARQRVERAIEAVGPELSGVLLDVCCFLKGLELVEAERGWPARSAKVMLKTALGMLARHYEPPARDPRGGRTAILHWGSPDYRPRVG